MFSNKNILLYPVSLIYGLITGLRNFMFNTEILKSVEFPLPVICVGNITIGGTGKTPHTEYIADLLSKHFNVAVLSRGYKRKTEDFIMASPSSTVQEIGDEPAQIKRKFPDISVAVDSNRVKGINRILGMRPDTEIIILDDGFQHRKLTPGFSILLSDFNRPMASDHLIPFGSLREGRHNARRADIILITKTPAGISPIERRLIVTDVSKMPYQNLYFTTLKYMEPVPVFENIPSVFNLGWNSYTGNGAVLVTGIANPKPLAEHLGKIFSEIIHLPFPDHHDFTGEDVATISRAWNELKSPVRYLMTTEKDAMRLRESGKISEDLKPAFYYIPVCIDFLNNDKEEFDKLIIEYVRKNKRNNGVPEKQGD